MDREQYFPWIRSSLAKVRKLVPDVSSDFLRRCFRTFLENRNAGGVHASFRTLQAFSRWLVDEEMMRPDWKNPKLNVKPPTVATEPWEPVGVHDAKALLSTCSAGTMVADRDRAVFLVLLDTGVRARELCDIDLERAALS